MNLGVTEITKVGTRSWLIAVIPFVNLVFTYLVTWFVCLMYNLFASRFGGIKIELRILEDTT